MTRYEDVEAALRDPSVVPPGSPSGKGPTAPAAPSFAGLLDSARWAGLRAALEQDLRHLLDRLPRGGAVDLAAAVARPWCLGLTRRLLELDAVGAEEALPLARTVFRAASSTPDGMPDEGALQAAGTLAALLSGTPGPGEGAARVQAFVALSCTLPLLLTDAWRRLLQHGAPVPPHPRALEELLRLAGPAGRVFRETTEAVEWGGVSIPAGARVVLDLAAANRDPDRFPEPERLDFGRGVCPHLALGAGLHPCAGAALVRAALRLSVEVLFGSGVSLMPAGPETPHTWTDASTIRGPATLPAVRTAPDRVGAGPLEAPPD